MSCDIYQSRFDCPPGKGVGCAPVGDILEMIVELEKGEDAFTGNREKALYLRKMAAKEPSRKTPNYPQRTLSLVRDEKGELVVVKEAGEEIGNS